MAFNTSLFMALLFLLGCKPALSSESSCSKNPSALSCQSLINKYADLRGTTFLNKYDEAVLLEEADLLRRKFQELSVEAHGVAPCISLSSESYANYFQAMSAGLRAHMMEANINNSYPKSKTNKSQEELFTRCTWDLGEVLIIATDTMFSKPDVIKDGASLVKLINKLNANEVNDNLACSLILVGLRQTQMLIDPRNENSIGRDSVEAELIKCNFHLETVDYSGVSDDLIEEKMVITARSNFSLLDQEITGWAEILRLVP